VGAGAAGGENYQSYAQSMREQVDSDSGEDFEYYDEEEEGAGETF
jgi:hypothetical protein